MSEKYLSPTFEAGKHLFQKNIEGTIINLNLIRLRTIADYSAHPDLRPAEEISGLEGISPISGKPNLF
ncbi:hypothetical protein [Chryseobacterium angstadtii]|uniref:hypothetical protein n=1 Tax=Chryseobacterium angstadtii TaxID=558151 RepID=UPI000AFB7141|nr:hypothetical protein [Chryseobacterium angstadtii]